MKSIEKIVDIQTGQETLLEHTLSIDQVAHIKAFELAEKEKADERAQKEAARQVVLAKLGLTAEEAQSLLG